ncbi:reverse transcriptase (RNA-dependent DNA polymerase) [Nonomuraea fuscirosea]|uniref:Reverse transcriptase (RNA-dependent DNA polymerase) n=1 Tax=Nonomuraea fuscirosea TaxID=1291556 RepID=A0A2T0M572_9ACTN|nr:RNA-directed DNA polymerase [Nonomuraea fuscirosea]PRX52604.1 reverse transcriptase (RNA-dependent DNA polymerase) [Nonomuraea fuscirosea]
MALVDDGSFRRAVENIGKWGDTDVFPFPIENHVMHDRTDDVITLLKQIPPKFREYINTDGLHSYSTLAPVGYTGFRWATQIDPMWNAYLLSLVISMASDIEQQRIPEDAKTVFSYRYRPRSSSLFSKDGWKNFQDRTRSLAESHGYVVTVDIADFYSRIYHHRLENALQNADPGKNKAPQVMHILGTISNGTSYGLPVGGPAARLLAELVLSRVDYLLMASPEIGPFCRYADDYRFFVNDLQKAYRILGFLSEKLLRNEGLSLQKSKTRIMTSTEYLSVLDPPNPPPGSAVRFLGLHIHFDPYSTTAVEDYEKLKAQLSQFDILGLLRSELTKGRIHAALTRRLVNALKFMDEEPREQAILSLLENIETLAPVVPQVMLAIRDALDSTSNQDFTLQVHRKVRQLIDESHIARIELNLSYIIRVLASSRSTENEHTLVRLYGAQHGYGSGIAPIIQRDIMLTMARWQAAYWLSDQKNYFHNFHPWVKRAFVIGSYYLGDEGKHWRDGNKSALRPFDLVVRDWAASKRNGAGDWKVPI